MREVVPNAVSKQSYIYRPFRDDTGVSILVGDVILYHSKKLGDVTAKIVALTIKVIRYGDSATSVVLTRNVTIQNLKSGRIYNVNPKNTRMLYSGIPQ